MTDLCFCSFKESFIISIKYLIALYYNIRDDTTPIFWVYGEMTHINEHILMYIKQWVKMNNELNNSIMANSFIVKFLGEIMYFQLRFELHFLCKWRSCQFVEIQTHSAAMFWIFSIVIYTSDQIYHCSHTTKDFASK